MRFDWNDLTSEFEFEFEFEFGGFECCLICSLFRSIANEKRLFPLNFFFNYLVQICLFGGVFALSLQLSTSLNVPRDEQQLQQQQQQKQQQQQQQERDGIELQTIESSESDIER
jgi:hypothetical protein